MGKERNFFRLVYPEHDHPIIRIGGRTCPVADLSEQGVRFLVPAAEPWTGVANELDGVIVFAEGEEVAVRGDVLRAGNEFVVLRFSQGVALSVMVREQLRLRRVHRRFDEGDLADGGTTED